MTAEPVGFTSITRRKYVNTTARGWLAKARAASSREWRSVCRQCALGARRGYPKVLYSCAA